MLRHQWTVDVDRPADEVSAWWQDFAFQLPRLRGSALGIRRTSPGPLGVGSTFKKRLPILGFEMTTNAVITEFDAADGITVSFKGGVVRSGAVRMRFEPTATGTRIVRILE